MTPTTSSVCLEIKPERLPTTEDTAFQHSRRVFQQCREWMLLDPDLTDTPFGWQWDRDKRMFLPVCTSKPVATKELETFISCNFQVCGHCSAEGNCQSLEAVEGQDEIASDDDNEWKKRTNNIFDTLVFVNLWWRISKHLYDRCRYYNRYTLFFSCNTFVSSTPSKMCQHTLSQPYFLFYSQNFITLASCHPFWSSNTLIISLLS